MGVLAGVADCGSSWKWGYGRGSRLGFKVKVATMWGGGNVRPCRKERVKGLLLVGHEKVSCGFGL